MQHEGCRTYPDRKPRSVRDSNLNTTRRRDTLFPDEVVEIVDHDGKMDRNEFRAFIVNNKGFERIRVYATDAH